MAEKIVEKLEILNQQAKILLARRIKKNSVQGYVKRKTCVRPLTFDFQLESKEAITPTSTSMTVSQSREDKPHGTTKTKRYVSFKNEPEPRKSDFEKLNLRLHAAPTNTKNQENKSMELPEENRKSRYDRYFLFLKDTDEVDYAKPLQYLFSPHKQEYKRTLGSTISSPMPSIQSNAYKKEKVAALFEGQTEKKPGELVVHLEDYVNERRKSPPQMNDFCTKENKPVRIDPLCESHAVGKKSLLPLCFEDELKKPGAKIINISPAKTVTDHKMNDFCTKENKPVRIDPLCESHAVGKKSLLPLCFEDELKKPGAKIINISPAKTVTDHKDIQTLKFVFVISYVSYDL
ncbi:PREDICTED: uncharacterized protein C1orf141 homolog [Myotis brandtii]|uniref:uncharacterized protein C1orf141 homolog n=1 Tax=Myotis brandtii TaxID=109478 RepID=UPI0003BBCD7D|nr:PREDICTED: uncharacterized protein C1orf141 homolog [Myotis brandtii]